MSYFIVSPLSQSKKSLSYCWPSHFYVYGLASVNIYLQHDCLRISFRTQTALGKPHISKTRKGAMKEKGSPQRHKTQTSHINTDLDSYKGNLYLVKDKHFPTLLLLWQHFFISTMTFTLTLCRTYSYRALKQLSN